MRFQGILLNAARLDWLLLLLLAPVLLFPERFPAAVVSTALALLVAGWSILYLATRRFFPPTPLNIPVLCLLLTVPLSLYASANFDASLPKLTGLLFGIAVFFIVARTAASEYSLPYAVLACLLSALGIAALGLVGTEWVGKINVLNRLTSYLPHVITGLMPDVVSELNPNEVAGLLALFIPFTLSAALASLPSPARAWAGPTAPQTRHKRLEHFVHLLYPDRRPGQLVWLISALLLGGVLILTQSRSALFGTLSALILIGGVRSVLLRRLLFTGIALALVLAAFIGPQALPGLLLGAGTAMGAGGSFNIAAREEIWSRALLAIHDFPFTGVGLNQFPAVVNLLYPLYVISPDAQIAHAHNMYLQAAVDFGLGGLVSYIAILGVAWLAAAAAYRALPGRMERAWVLGLAAGLLAHQLYGLSDAITLGAKPSFLWWVFLGLIMGFYTRSQSMKPAKAVWLRISSLEACLLWLLSSLVAIAAAGENALLGVGLAVLGGCLLACAALLAHAQK